MQAHAISRKPADHIPKESSSFDEVNEVSPPLKVGTSSTDDSDIRKSLKETITRTKIMERMIKNNRHSLDKANYRFRMLVVEQSDTRRDTASNLKNVAQAIERLDDMFQIVQRKDMDLKADMVGA